MTLQTAECSKTFIGAGTTGPFTWTWRFFANGHITAVKTVAGVEVPLSEGTDYTLTGANGYQGGTLNLVAALLTGETLYVERNTPAIQSIDLRNQGDFFPETYEDALDYGMAIKQEQNRDANLHLRLTPPGTGVSVTMPLPSSGMGVRWNTEGDALEAVGLNAETWDAEPGTRAAVDAGLQSQIDSNDAELADHEDRVSRSLKFPVGDTTSPAIPDATTRANKALGFDLAGVPVAFDVAADLSGYAISKTPVADALPQYDSDGVIQGTNIVHRVDTIADLRLITGSPGRSAVQVLGYYAAGDGGGGPVRHWVSGKAVGYYTAVTGVEPDDGGAIIVPTGGDGSGAWVFSTVAILDPVTFGAIGDGVTDDTLALQETFTAAAGKTIIPTPRTYLTGPLIMSSDTTLSGSGSTLLAKPGLPLGVILSTGASVKSGIRIHDLRIDGNRANQTSTVTGISFGDSSFNSEVSGCVISEMSGSAIQIAGHDIIIEKNIINYTNRNAINAPSTVSHPVYNILVRGNTILLDAGGNGYAGAIEFDDGAHDVIIDGNICSGPTTIEHLIQLEQGSYNGRIVNNRTTGGQHGIYVGDLSTQFDANTVVSNNHTSGALSTGIFIEKANYVTVVGNISEGNGDDGIRFALLQYGTVSGNVSVNNGQINSDRYGILSSGCSYSSFTGNLAFDTQGTKTQKYGFYSTGGSNNTFSGNGGTGNITSNFIAVDSSSASMGNIGSTKDYMSPGAYVYSEIKMNNRFHYYSGSFVDGATSPDVSTANAFVTANTAPTVISAFTGGQNGQQITVGFGDTNTTVDFTGTSLRGNGGVDWTPAVGDSMICSRISAIWYCQISNNTL
jgi:hypothetical protein